MFYVYVLRSIEYGRYYIWYSSNLEKRITEHNDGKTKSTKFYQPYQLVYHEVFDSKTKALKREKELKRMKWSSSFKKIIMPG